jgi:hypothetical protein
MAARAESSVTAFLRPVAIRRAVSYAHSTTAACTALLP